MKAIKALLTLAAVVLTGAANVNAHAQTVQAVVIGSSALFLEAGQAAANNPSLGGCVWTKKKGTITAVDSRPTTAVSENGAVWITWQPGTGSCASPAGTYNIYAEMNTDSVIGDRCVMASPACTMNFNGLLAGAASDTGVLPASTIPTPTPLPGSVLTALSGASFNTAATDIRAEDGKFATIRALTSCGATVDGSTTSQYLGLGFAAVSGGVVTNPHIGANILESTYAQGQAAAASQGSFHVLDFNLTGTDPISGAAVKAYQTYDVGAAPIVVFVNPGNASGFGSLLVSNVTRQTLAGYLDGTFLRAGDLVNQAYAGSGSGPQTAAVSVFVREPLSGTYNTMEYNVPNSVAIKSSQDVGINQGFNITGAGTNPCGAALASGYVPVNAAYNPLSDAFTPAGSSSITGHSGRYRAIGTGDEVAATLNTSDSIGYSFWSAANFANAGATNAKYLTVDGVDPLQQVWGDGLVPTVGNGLLGNVSLANVRNGSYPIWSKLRLVTTLTGASNGASLLAAAAQTFVSPTQPDFIPVSQLNILRSHFAPPFNGSSVLNANFPSALGLSIPANGNSATTCAAAEAGGDVGGLPISLQADGDFCKDTGGSPNGGDTGHRQ